MIVVLPHFFPAFPLFPADALVENDVTPAFPSHRDRLTSTSRLNLLSGVTTIGVSFAPQSQSIAAIRSFGCVNIHRLRSRGTRDPTTSQHIAQHRYAPDVNND